MRQIIIVLVFAVSTLFCQDLSGIRICIDPGHGGQESDDRHMVYANFWESESNLTKGLELQEILVRLGASVKITRTGNYDPAPVEESWEASKPDDPTLSERVEMANSFNADYFNSIHSNGYNGTANYTLMIYNGYTNQPRIQGSQTMAEILAPEVYAANRTASHTAMGDLTLNPTWSYGYGVLYPANMPATISEGSFHDYVAETWRLQNLDYRKNESHAIARAFLEYFGQPGFSTGSLAGIVRDVDNTVDYYVISGSGDIRTPVNNIDVSINPGNIHYTGDSNNNGYFCVDSLTPGAYTVEIMADGFITASKTMSVIANKTSFVDFNLTAGGDDELPTSFSLSPNYPNPFNLGTYIPFSLPKDASVIITIYDLVGRKVTQLVNGSLEAGYHETHWLASGMTSGIYLAKMDVNDISITQKITLLK